MHHWACDWHLDQVPADCCCGATRRVATWFMQPEQVRALVRDPHAEARRPRARSDARQSDREAMWPTHCSANWCAELPPSVIDYPRTTRPLLKKGGQLFISHRYLETGRSFGIFLGQ
jgi:hypothetical protein